MSVRTVTWESPANIAIVKYWGKKGFQLPANPSISFTLSACKTITSITAEPDKRNGDPVSFEYFFEGEKRDFFNRRVEKYLHMSAPFLPFLSRHHLVIRSRNTFPHSAGIASSASSMSALALCLLDLDYSSHSETSADTRTEDFLRQASHLGRLGSGSACRSLYPHAALWGESPRGGSDEYAVPVSSLHQTFKTYRDSVLIVSSREKETSSRSGHQSMDDHPYRERRYHLARERTERVLAVLQEGDEDALGNILEQEALELHALAATATPSCLYWEPATLRLIKNIRRFRQDSALPLHFTLDAGANIHLLYPDRLSKTVRTFIDTELKDCLQSPFVIHDHVGEGPQKIL